MLIIYFNPFVLKVPFLYSLKTSENCKIFWSFQGLRKGCIKNKWVKENAKLYFLDKYKLPKIANARQTKKYPKQDHLMKLKWYFMTKFK